MENTVQDTQTIEFETWWDNNKETMKQCEICKGVAKQIWDNGFNTGYEIGYDNAY